MGIMSKLKRASYVGVAMALVLTMMPVGVGGSAWAAECEGPTTNDELKAAVKTQSSVTLCEDIEGGVNIGHAVSGNIDLTLNLNGHSISTASGKALIVSSNASVTINGVGEVNGGIQVNGSLTINSGSYSSNINVFDGGKLIVNGGTFAANFGLGQRNGAGAQSITINDGVFTGATVADLIYANSAESELVINGGDFTGVGGAVSKQNKLSEVSTITGGTFASDPSSHVKDPYAAYKSGNVWVIETKLTNENIAAPGTITIKEGEVFDVASAMEAPADSTTGWVYYSRNNNVANISYGGTNSEGSNGLLGLGIGSTSIAVRPTHDTTLIKNINVVVESGLKDINIDGLTMLQEDEKSVEIENEYYFDRASGVSYEVVSVSGEKIEAEISDNELIIKTGEAGVVEPGEYTVKVRALVNGEETEITKDVTVKVEKLFTDFSLEQADENDKITIREDKYFTLKVSGAKESAVNVDNVKVKSVELLEGGDVMHVKADRIAGDKKGVGTGKIKVTAEYTSGNNVYTLEKEFDVEVTSALEKIAIREASDTKNNGIRYGTLNGETSEILLDQNDTKELKISKYNVTAAVDYEVVSSDTAVADVTLDEETGEFTVAAKKAGTTTITVTVTPKNAESGAGAITNSFEVTVYPILISVDAESYEIELYEGDMSKKIAISRVVEDAVKDDVSWTYEVADEAVATVAEDGTITPVKDGETFVTVKGTFVSPLGKTYVVATEQPVKVTVKPLLTGVRIYDAAGTNTKPSIVQTLYENDTAEYKVAHINKHAEAEYRVESSDESVATATLDGNKLTVKTYENTTTSGNEVIITVYAKDKNDEAIAEVSRSIKIAVKPTLKRISAEEVYLVAGDEEDLNVLWENAQIEEGEIEFSYESEDEEVVTVSADGKVKGVEAGETTVKVTASYDGKTVEGAANVHVYEMVAPEETSHHGQAGDEFGIEVTDKNENAYTEAEVVEGEAEGLRFSDDYAEVTAESDGIYKVLYTDYMANGETVGTYLVTIVVVTPEVETFFVRKGETVEIDGNEEYATDVATDGYGEVEYAVEDGKVKFDAADAELGTYGIVMTHDFSEYGDETLAEVVTKVAMVVVYDVVGDENDDMSDDADRAYVADFVAEHIAEMIKNESTEDEQVVLDIDIDDLKMLLAGGAKITTRLETELLDEEEWEDAEAYDKVVLKIEDESGIVAMYEVYLAIYADDFEIGLVYELDDEITMRLEIPEEYVTTPDGYTRKFTVVRGHLAADWTETAEELDAEQDGNYLEFKNNKFSSFAISYADTLIPVAPNTGMMAEREVSSNGTSATVSMLTTVVAMLGMVSLAGAVAFAKRQK